ncbi:MAG: hypothetical protein EXS09_11960 [Gemmataceae bacterium]|nr:hypothetical protein [Gemmataceae bacterium]
MSPFQRLLFVPIFCTAGSVFAQDLKLPRITKDDPLPKLAGDGQDVTFLRKITDRTFVHEEAKVSFTVPAGWKEIKPQRLARKIDRRVSTVLRIEETEKDVVASLYWIPMNPGQKMSEWVRDTPANGEYGEEYETIKAVYGAPPKVSLPTKSKVGPFEVYRIDINGQDRDKHDGVLYLFEVKSGSTSWLFKARISYPKGDRVQYDPYALKVLGEYSMLPGGVDKK